MIDSGSFSPIANLFLMELVEPAAFFSVVDGVFFHFALLLRWWLGAAGLFKFLDLTLSAQL